MTVGLKIKLARIKKGLTQKQVAEQIGVKQPSYHEWECGERTPSWERMKALSKVLEVSLEELAKDD